MTTDKRYCECERVDGNAEFIHFVDGEERIKQCKECGQEWVEE